MKPILFNTEMVRAILDGRKTVTRRVVKPQPPHSAKIHRDGNCFSWSFWEDSDKHSIKLPYHPGDIMYVRETWNTNPLHKFGNEPNVYVYKADYDGHAGEFGWHPSIHMSKEAARIFLRVKNVRVERLQDITEDEALKEGCGVFAGVDWVALPREDFSEKWDNTIKPEGRALYGWEANPWVWVIEFERISKEKAS